MPFEFQKDSLKPDGEPDGDRTFIFRKFGTGEYEEYDADTMREAWDGVYYNHGTEWKEWMCIGRADIVRYQEEVTDKERHNIVSSTPGSHPIEFAAMYPDTVQVWEDID